MIETQQSAFSDADCRSRLALIFSQHGFFPSSHQFLLQGDAAFSWKRRLQVFKTTPHLRLALVLGSLANLICGWRRAPKKGARTLRRSAWMGGDGNSFYFNGLILEL